MNVSKEINEELKVIHKRLKEINDMEEYGYLHNLSCAVADLDMVIDWKEAEERTGAFIIAASPNPVNIKLVRDGVDWAAPIGTPIPEKSGRVVKTGYTTKRKKKPWE